MGVLTSIVTPLYNKGAYIGETIASVLRQSTPDWEMLVVDNGSTDDGPQIVRQMALDDPRIHLLEFTQRQGPGAARNFGLDAAVGEWVLFLDADDLMAPTYLEDRLITPSGIAVGNVVAGPWEEFADGRPDQLELRHPPGWQQPRQQLVANAVGFAPWPPHAAFVRRAHLNRERRWQEDLDHLQSEDTAFWFRVLLDARLIWSSAKGALYRKGTPSSRDAIRDVRKRFNAICAVTDSNTAFLKSSGMRIASEHRNTLVRVFEGEAQRAAGVDDMDVARAARHKARGWLTSGSVLMSPGMLLRRILGLRNFQWLNDQLRRLAGVRS